MLNRRNLILTAVAATAAPNAVTAASSVTTSTALAEAFDRIVNMQLAISPETCTVFGLDRGAHADAIHRLDDRSLAGRAALRSANRRQLDELRAIPRATLGADNLIDYDSILYGLQTQVDADRRFDPMPAAGFPYVLSQLTGAYQSAPDILENQHRIETAEDAEAYLERLAGLAKAFDQDVECSRHDSAAGVVAPDFALDKALAQMKAMRSEAADQSQLVQSLVRRAADKHIAGDWAGRAAGIYQGQVQPALDRQIAEATRLRSVAGHDAGVWRLPDGEAFYEASLKSWTSSPLGVEEIHRIGLELVDQLSSALDQALKAQGLSQGGVAERLQALNEAPDAFYPNTDEGRAQLFAGLHEMVAAVEAKLPAYFGTLPKARLNIVRVPKSLEVGRSAGYYSWPSLDGTRPGAFYINLRDTHEAPKWKLPTLVFHEALPGHHLQISLQAEAKLPLLRKVTSFNAYIEGWGLYAEQLADEMGMYRSDPRGRIGYLQSATYRAVRLVVDTGMHHKRWSREQALAYFQGKVGGAEKTVASEIERYCVWPGQACTYMLGKLEWSRLRDKAKATLGARFDIRKFHDAGLLAGAVPLAVLEQIIDRYIASA